MPIETDPAETPEDTTTADPQAEEEAAESPETETGEGSETSEEQGKVEEKPDEVEIVIDGEPAKVEEPPKDHAAWAKMRKRESELAAENAQLKREAQARSQPAAEAPGQKPTKESCEWDDDRFERELLAWHEKSRLHEAKKAKAAQDGEEVRRAWDQTRATAAQSRAELIKRMPGYLDAELKVNAALGSNEMGFDRIAAIVEVCEGKAPAVFAALGQDPARLKDLATTKSAARFIAKVSKLEDKVQQKKKGTTPPPPEGKPKGTGGSSGAVDHERERLLDEATKSGNINKLRAYDKSKRAK